MCLCYDSFIYCSQSTHGHKVHVTTADSPILVKSPKPPGSAGDVALALTVLVKVFLSLGSVFGEYKPL